MRGRLSFALAIGTLASCGGSTTKPQTSETFAVLATLLPGKPLIFDGQEVGMNVFDGQTVRPSMSLGHDPRVKLDWADPDGYRPFYTKLLQLFRANPALHQPGMADFRKLALGVVNGRVDDLARFVAGGQDQLKFFLNRFAKTLM